MQLTYNQRNLVGGGCKEKVDAGLSAFGVEVVRKLNEMRVAIDVSHASEQTLLDSIECSDAPVICSHANARALCNAPRNLSDRAILAIAEKGGVIGVNSFGTFVKSVPPTVEDMLDHVDYVVRLAGLDSVGVGSDLFEGRHHDFMESVEASGKLYGMEWEDLSPSSHARKAGRTIDVEACEDPSHSRRALGLRSVLEMPNVANGLRRRGYGSEQIEKLRGGNFLRVLRKIWGA